MIMSPIKSRTGVHLPGSTLVVGEYADYLATATGSCCVPINKFNEAARLPHRLQ
jgi:hypothetical protein